ncbi:MAG TPA: M20 family metallopeptidase [Ktedonobacterales bacterium]|jgi:glutamate carboxypeptidase|nr:M20 family metallopeptidase [Ktedonobacterales bacterium]
MDTTALFAAAQAQVESFLSDLAELVDIDSGTYTPEGVARVADALQGRFEAAGALVERVAGTEYGPQLVARWPGAGKGRILLVGHMDTVFPDGEVMRRPFRIEDGRAYGPGVMDMKSGLLVGLYAARLLRGEAPWAELVMVCNSDEEIGSPSSHDLIAHLASEADAVLVLEPNSRVDKVVIARKGVATFRLDVTGLSAHAGVEPGKGHSAIIELSHRMIAVHALNETMPGVTLNVGVVHGGERPNIVPDHAHALIDVRAPDPDSVAAVEAALRRVADAEPIIAGTETRLSGRFAHHPFTQSVASKRLFGLADSVARELGFALTGGATGGGSDGNTAAAVGAATLDGLGPVGGHAHNPGEYIEIASIAPRLALVCGVIAGVGGLAI